jgi:LEA14-like dessication related protein
MTLRSRSLSYRAAFARALLVAAGLSVFPGCASFGSLMEAPEVSVVNLVPEASSGFEQRFKVDLRITNPNERPLEVDGLRFELDLNGQRLARGQSGDSVTVPRLGDAVISVNATTTLLDVFRQVWAMQKAKSVRYRVEGRVFLKGLLPPYVDFEREDELMTLPEPAPPAPKG